MGLIAPPDAPPDAVPDAPPDEQESGGNKLTEQNLQSKMTIPPELKTEFEAAVLHGKQIMYDKSTHKLAMQGLQGPGPMPQKLGTAIAALVLHQWEKSGQKMDLRLLIPVGIALLADAAKFLQQAGMADMTDDDIAQAMSVLNSIIMQKANLDPSKVGAAQPGQPQPGAQPGAQPPQPPQGLIAGQQ